MSQHKSRRVLLDDMKYVTRILLPILCLLVLLPAGFTNGQNDGLNFDLKVNGGSRQKASRLKYAWDNPDDGEQLGSQRRQHDLQEPVAKVKDKYSNGQHQMEEKKKLRKKEKQGKKLQFQVRNGRSLDDDLWQENVKAKESQDGDLNLFQQPLKEGDTNQQQGYVNARNDQSRVGDNVRNYQQPVNKEPEKRYQKPLEDNPWNTGQLKDHKNADNLQQDSQQPILKGVRNYQQPRENNAGNYQHVAQENAVNYQVPLKQNFDILEKPLQENVGNQQESVKRRAGNYLKLESDNGLNDKDLNNDMSNTLGQKIGKKQRNQRYRRNEDMQQEGIDNSKRNYGNKGKVESLNDEKLQAGFKEANLNQMEQDLLAGKYPENKENFDDNNLPNMHLKQERYNVLPTIDNNLVVQQSQVGLTRKNRSEVQPENSLGNPNPHEQNLLGPLQQDSLEEQQNKDQSNINKMKQNQDALKNKNFDHYQKQSVQEKNENQFFQEQDSFGAKKGLDGFEQKNKKAADQQDLFQDNFKDKYPPGIRGDEEKHKSFHIETNVANGGNMESDLAEAQRIIGSDFKQVHAAKSKRKFAKGPARPHPSQRKNVIFSEESQSYNLKLSADNQFRIGYAPIPKDGTPWPMPQFYSPSDKVYLIKPENFQINSVGESCDILEFSIQRARMNMFGDDNVSSSDGDHNFHLFREEDSEYPEVKSLNVTVLKECGMFPQFAMEESYDLEVRRSGAVLIAREVWGAIRGLETFTQLVYQNQAGQYLVNKTLIHDFPRFKHRGVLLDTSRHYLNKETIIINLEAMAQNKLNVFHWHIVDEQSFPFESKTYPNLTRMGAYSASHVYTPEMVADIINEARLRGIRVIPEFDTPGHTFSWGLGQDNLLTPCYDYNGVPTGYFGPINPILKSTYKFLQGLFSEVMSVFKDKFIHLGGDEVPLECWQTNPFLERFLTRNHLYETKDLLNIYMKKLFEIIKNTGKSRTAGSGKIVWQEVFDNGVELDKETIVQVWMGDAWDIDRVTSQGHYILFSTCWYLNYISYGMDWEKYYKCEQIGSHLDMYNVRNLSLIMGGEVCLWTEFADDESILSRLWPRASAAAERLWSHKDVMDPQEAAPRLEEQRCRMKRRGLPVGVLSGPGFCRKYSKPQKFKPLAWNSNSKGRSPNSFDTNDVSANKHIYVVDVNSMYTFPLIVLLCIIGLSILISLGHKSNGQKPFLAKLRLPGIATRKSVKGLVFIFMAFAVVWCIWTAPIWMHTWENDKTPT